jgi:hypothetical protein
MATGEEDFWGRYDTLIQKTRTTLGSKGYPLYYPWKELSFKYPVTVDNILKMWHSMHSAWLLMERHATDNNVQYTRVAMLRSDVMYATPIDIYRLDNGGNDHSDSNDTAALIDHENRFAVPSKYGRPNDSLVWKLTCNRY